MNASTPQRSARIVLLCKSLQPNLEFFQSQLHLRLDGISPADDPRIALLSGGGLNLELRVGPENAQAVLRIEADGAESRDLCAPNGTLVELRPTPPDMTLPEIEHELVITRLEGEGCWGTGRAGMQYRDLIPGRLGGRFIASHIRIPKGGPVPDVVHYHHIRFQMIFCVKGWVRVAYQDQGEPQLLEPGGCLLQPPGMRHQVLESSDGLEVIEIASPAEHNTWVDHDHILPSDSVNLDQEYGGQRFVFHRAKDADWRPHEVEGIHTQDFGIAAATHGLAQVQAVRMTSKADMPCAWPATNEFLFVYVLRGAVRFESAGNRIADLREGDSASLPPTESLTLATAEENTEWLEVRL